LKRHLNAASTLPTFQPGNFIDTATLNWTIRNTSFGTHDLGKNTSSKKKRVVVTKMFSFPIWTGTKGNLAYKCCVAMNVNFSTKHIHVVSAYPQ
jgi:hypothetical protein